MVSGRQAITNFKDETFKFDTKIDFNGEDPTEDRELVKSQVIDAIYALQSKMTKICYQLKIFLIYEVEM
jgi:hypothetical protein